MDICKSDEKQHKLKPPEFNDIFSKLKILLLVLLKTPRINTE